MKRLREMPAQDAQLARAQALIDAGQSPPLSELQRQRVRRAIEERYAAAGLRGRLRRAPALLLAAAIGLFGASAFAAVRYVVLDARPAAPPRPAEPRARVEAPAVSREPARAAPPLPAPQPASADAPQPALARPEEAAVDDLQAPTQPPTQPQVRRAEPEHRRARRVRRRAAEPATASAVVSAVASAEPVQAPEPVHDATLVQDSARVHRAVRALRRDGDPARAARLLAEQRRRGLAGPLSEEVLALQIEAAQALGDPQARSFAREYLRRYPEGRYLDRARSALSASTP